MHSQEQPGDTDKKTQKKHMTAHSGSDCSAKKSQDGTKATHAAHIYKQANQQIPLQNTLMQIVYKLQIHNL